MLHVDDPSRQSPDRRDHDVPRRRTHPSKRPSPTGWSRRPTGTGGVAVVSGPVRREVVVRTWWSTSGYHPDPFFNDPRERARPPPMKVQCVSEHRSIGAINAQAGFEQHHMRANDAQNRPDPRRSGRRGGSSSVVAFRIAPDLTAAGIGAECRTEAPSDVPPDVFVPGWGSAASDRRLVAWIRPPIEAFQTRRDPAHAAY